MPAEFDCCECGTHIIFVTALTTPKPPLCALCLFWPGWFKDPKRRAFLDPHHDGREVLERIEPRDGAGPLFSQQR